MKHFIVAIALAISTAACSSPPAEQIYGGSPLPQNEVANISVEPSCNTSYACRIDLTVDSTALNTITGGTMSGAQALIAYSDEARTFNVLPGEHALSLKIGLPDCSIYAGASGGGYSQEPVTLCGQPHQGSGKTNIKVEAGHSYKLTVFVQTNPASASFGLQDEATGATQSSIVAFQ